jgi:hypothetical protein
VATGNHENKDQKTKQMRQERKQAGPSSARPEEQQGLKETQQSGGGIVKGAHDEDQLEQIKENAKGAGDKKADPDQV